MAPSTFCMSEASVGMSAGAAVHTCMLLCTPHSNVPVAMATAAQDVAAGRAVRAASAPELNMRPRGLPGEERRERLTQSARIQF